jgi:hypothetical protein
MPNRLGSARLPDYWLAFGKNIQKRATLLALNAFPDVHGIGLVDIAVAWTHNFDHDVVRKRQRRNDIPFWDIGARLAIIQPP